MNVVDPRDLDDRALLSHLLFGDLPRAGWDRRGALARRALYVAGITVLAITVLLVVCAAIVVLWAMRPAA